MNRAYWRASVFGYSHRTWRVVDGLPRDARNRVPVILRPFSRVRLVYRSPR